MSDFFIEMEKNIYVDHDQICSNVTACRESFTQVNETFLENEPYRIILPQIDYIPDGRVDFEMDRIMLETFFHFKDTPKLYVFLSGKRTAETPEFKRWSYYNMVSGSMLNIADPMYRQYDGLECGWYWGDDKIDLRETIVTLVENVASFLKLTNQDIIYISSSAGGAAAIECGALTVGSKVFALNPQIRIYEHFLAPQFAETTGIDLCLEDKWHRNELDWYINKNDSWHIFLINIRSKQDMKQLDIVIKNLGKSAKVKYGLNIIDHLIIWLYDAEAKDFNPHGLQESRCIFFVMDYLLYLIDRGISDTDYGWIVLINEFWHEYWCMQRDLIQHIERIKKDEAIIKKDNVILDVFSRWIMDIANATYVTTFLNNNEFKRIAIYGYGALGKALYEMLRQTEIEVCYIIEVDQKRWTNLKQVDFYSPNEELPVVDVVIITAITYYYEIAQTLSKKLGCPLLSLDDIIE